jgi:hypothetical protein
MPRLCVCAVFLLAVFAIGCDVTGDGDISFVADRPTRLPWARVQSSDGGQTTAVMVSPRVAVRAFSVEPNEQIITYDKNGALVQRTITRVVAVHPDLYAMVLDQPVDKGSYRYPVVPSECTGGTAMAIGGLGDAQEYRMAVHNRDPYQSARGELIPAIEAGRAWGVAFPHLFVDAPLETPLQMIGLGYSCCRNDHEIYVDLTLPALREAMNAAKKLK